MQGNAINMEGSSARGTRGFTLRALLALCAASVLMLTGCGGGEAQVEASSELEDLAAKGGNGGGKGGGRPTKPPKPLTLPQAISTLTPVLNGQYLLSAEELRAGQNAPVSVRSAVTAEQVLNWAQTRYPQRFVSASSTLIESGVTYRNYTSGIALGGYDTKVYAYGSATDNTLIQAGSLGDYACAISPSSCELPPVLVPTGPFACAQGALGCVQVVSTGAVLQNKVPATFGLPFKVGSWNYKSAGLSARDSAGQTVPVQGTDVSEHPDGSARFAVVSMVVDNLAPGEQRVVNFFAGPSASITPVSTNANFDVQLEAKVYAPQVTRVRFGNRSGSTSGIPFVVGETVSMTLTMGGATESYSVLITDTLAGGLHPSLTRIAEEFMKKINANTTVYEAYKPSGSYENLYIKTKRPDMGAFSVSISYAGEAQIAVVNTTDFSNPKTYRVQAAEALKAAITKGNSGQTDASVRFAGPVASEYHLSLPLKEVQTGEVHPALHARLDVRAYEGGAHWWTDVVLENSWVEGRRNVVYELSILKNGQVEHYQPFFEHFHHARWHKGIWSQKPQVQVRQHMRSVIDAGFLWNYDLAVTIPETQLARAWTDLQRVRAEQAALGPMGNVFLTPYMPTTGGRGEIGPIPRWMAQYVISQDVRAQEVMLAVADASASVPIHYRDRATDQPINTIVNGTFSTYSGGGDTISDPTIWAADTAHQGSYGYIPYLVTGSRFYLDEMMFWAKYNIFSMPAGYRGNSLSLVNGHQVRAQAWALRSIAEAQRVLPVAHPMQSVFSTMLQNNLDWYHNHYVVQKLGAPFGGIQHSSTEIGPWQNDFVAIVFASLAQNNAPKAKEVLDTLSGFTVGRFTAQEQGFCPQRAPGYYWKFVDASGVRVSTWGQMFAINYPADVGKTCESITDIEGYPTWSAGYGAYGRAMLAASANAQVGAAANGYVLWKSLTPLMDKDFANDPTWAIVPR